MSQFGTRFVLKQCSARNFFRVVYEVEKYNQFLPWCSTSTILKRQNQNYFESELTIDFKIYSSSYISQVYTNQLHTNRFEIKSISNNNSVFQRLESIWEIQQSHDSSSTDISYHINYQFNNSVFQSVSESVFATICQKMTNSFEKRYNQLSQSDYFNKTPCIYQFENKFQEDRENINNNSELHHEKIIYQNQEQILLEQIQNISNKFINSDSRNSLILKLIKELVDKNSLDDSKHLQILNLLSQNQQIQEELQHAHQIYIIYNNNNQEQYQQFIKNSLIQYFY